MARKLNTFVTVHRRDENGQVTGESGTFGPDDDLSKPENAWVEKSITNPDVWDDGHDEKTETADKADGGDKQAASSRRSGPSK